MIFAPLPRRRFVPRLDRLEDRTLLAVCVVDRLTDLGEGQGLRGDLRYCITQANELPGDDTITFDVTGTINLTRALLDLSTNIDIQGPGASLLTLQGGSFTVASGTTGSISGLTISDGFTYRGGGIFNSGTLSLSGLTISNSFGEEGGGIFNSGTLTISNSIISTNEAVDGGGIYNSGTLTISNSTVSGNAADADVTRGGGGILNDGTLTVSNSTISGNWAGGFSSGGGIANSGMASISNSTISGNSSSLFGGGMFNEGTLTVSNSTISANDGFMEGGGIRMFAGTLHMRNSILAGNTARSGPDLFGSLTSSGYNLIGNTEGGSGFRRSDLLNIDPRLGPLRDNGGPTFTHALLPGSPAIDRGHPKTDPEGFDQRGEGFPRVVGGRVDIGAFEVQGADQAAPPGAGAVTAAVLGDVIAAMLLEQRELSGALQMASSSWTVMRISS